MYDYATAIKEYPDSAWDFVDDNGRGIPGETIYHMVPDKMWKVKYGFRIRRTIISPTQFGPWEPDPSP